MASKIFIDNPKSKVSILFDILHALIIFIYMIEIPMFISFSEDLKGSFLNIIMKPFDVFGLAILLIELFATVNNKSFSIVEILTES